MPWTTEDVDRHKKGLSDKQKKTWIKVANGALKRCQDKGGDDCEASAIRQANSVVGQQKEVDGYRAYTTSTNSVLLPVNAIDVNGEAVPVGELVAAYLGQLDEGDNADQEEEKSAEVDIGQVRGLLQEALAMLDAPQEELEEAQLSESAAGHAVALEEAGANASPRDPLVMNVALIKPGFGNKADNHYYPAETLKRDAKVFEGVKMYATDHRPDEKSVRTEVAVVKACPVAFSDDGAPIARVAVHDPGFAEQARNRAKLGTLGSLECSILALGKTKKGKVGDKETNIVEAITKGQSVDWVTKAGAGGHAVSLAENDTGGATMSEQEKDKDKLVEETSQEAQTEEVTLAEQEQVQEQEAPQKLAEAEVDKLVEATNLPAAFKAALKAVTYSDEEAVKAAIAEAVDAYKKATGSGKPFAQGGSQPAQDKPLSEREKTIRFNERLKAVGGRPVPVPTE